jgi:hypothetical protein
MLIIIWFLIAISLILYGGGYVPWPKPFSPTATTATYCLAMAMIFAHVALQTKNRKQPSKYGYYSIAGSRGSW